MHGDHAPFLNGIHTLLKVDLTFWCKEDGQYLLRSCAPMDYGPSRRTRDQSNRYHFWDYDSDLRRHTLTLPVDQVAQIRQTSEPFTLLNSLRGRR